MPEDVATLPAESSPAEGTPQATQQETVSVPTNAEDYAQWRLTGKLPDEPSKEDSAPPKKKPLSQDSAPAARKSPSSGDSATPHLKRQGYGDQRKEELNEEIRDLIAKRDQIRQEVEGKQPAPRDVKPAAEPSNAQPADQRPKKPKQEDFKTWDEYETAKDRYDEALVDWKANQKIEEYVQRQKQEAATQEMQVRLDKAKERYGEEAETTITGTARAVFEEAKIAPAIKAALGRSDVMVDALYVMGSDKKELDSFIDLSIKDPLEALRKWFTVEALVRQELQKPARAQSPPSSNGAPQRDEDGKFVKAPPARISRQAPAPPTELGGNSSPPGDELERAAASGDVRGFMQEANRRDFARWKGQI